VKFPAPPPRIREVREEPPIILKQTDAQSLFFKLPSSSTSLTYAAGKATTYEAAVSEQRELIKERLADYRAKYMGGACSVPGRTSPLR
jgi:hypothetical protein